MTTSLPYEELLTGATDERTSAARTIREAATETPTRLHGSLSRLADALADDEPAVRVDVATAIRAVAVADPTAVAPVAESLVAALADDSEAVQADVARAVGDLAVVRPKRVAFALPDLVDALTTDSAVRQEVGRALAALAPRYPERCLRHVDAISRSLLDDHHPVQQCVLRTLVPLERTAPGVVDDRRQRVRDLVTADVAAVRQAACELVAVDEPPWARMVLEDRHRDDPHPAVRETARAALTALDADGTTPPDHPDGTVDVFESVTVRTWLAVDVDDDSAPDLLVGRVTGVERSRRTMDAATAVSRGVDPADFDSRSAWFAAPRVEPMGDRASVHLHNPFGEFGVNLDADDDGLTLEYTSVDQERRSLGRPETVRPCSPDLARLLAARPGDRLAFELDGAAHEVTVRTAAGQDRLVGENSERGYEITFRPTGPDPLMAVFRKGRAFRASNVQLRTDD